MSPPIRDGSGDSIGSIRLGDGSGISEVRTGAGDVLFSAIPDSVVTQYRYEDDSDTTVAIDSVGSNNGDITGATYSASSRCDSLAIETDGSDDDVISQNTVDLVASGDSDACGIATFVQSDGTNSRFNTPIAWRVDGNNKLRVAVDSGTFIAQFQVGGNGAVVDSGVAISSSSYQHVGVSLTQSEFAILVDGTVEATQSHSQDITNIGAASYSVGSRGGDENFGGLFDNSTFSNSELTEAVASELINQC